MVLRPSFLLAAAHRVPVNSPLAKSAESASWMMYSGVPWTWRVHCFLAVLWTAEEHTQHWCGVALEKIYIGQHSQAHSVMLVVSCAGSGVGFIDPDVFLLTQHILLNDSMVHLHPGLSFYLMQNAYGTALWTCQVKSITLRWTAVMKRGTGTKSCLVWVNPLITTEGTVWRYFILLFCRHLLKQTKVVLRYSSIDISNFEFV